MQLLKTETKFNIKEVEQLLLNENKFITNLLTISAIPERRTVEDEDIDSASPIPKPNFNNSDKKPRAKSLHELEERLKAITTNKKKLTYKEKLTKKGLKNRMKKKNKQDERNAKLKLERAGKLSVKNKMENYNLPPKNTQDSTNEDKKPVFNKDNKIVFSKIDFSNLGKKKIKKQVKDPEKLLKKMTEEKEKLEQLEQRGEIQKVVQMKEKTAWKNALAKAEGQKVKDDPLLLKKSVHKKEQKVRSSKKKWEARIQRVENTKEEKQKKRSENIQKRKKEKKIKKLKTAAKRGKIIPGF